LLSLLIVYSITINNKNIPASFEGEVQVGGRKEAEDLQQDAIEDEEDSIAEGFLEEHKSWKKKINLYLVPRMNY
jgi:hypothetical protein